MVSKYHGFVVLAMELLVCHFVFFETHPKVGIDVLWEPDLILKNAEEYANGGMDFLKMLYDDSDEPLEALEDEFRKYLK